MTPPSHRLMADVSSNNGFINIANYSRAGHVALAIKATQGTSYVNPFHQGQANLAHDFGLTVIHYHYCKPGSNPITEIEHFRHIYSKTWRNGDYACFDIEEPEVTNLNYANHVLAEYHRRSGREPILYTSRGFLEGSLHGVVVPGGRIWVADWSSKPLNYGVWARQYTDGIIGPEPHYYSGIGRCDGSYITAGVAGVLRLRKFRTRRRK